MNKRFNHSGFLAIAILVSLILAAVTPGMVFAEGEAPEVVPPETISPEPTESVAEVVSLLAEEEAVIVDDVGEPVPMASQTAIDVLCEPDPWFYCSACAGGKSPSYVTLLEAINAWDDLRGYGFIYVQGGLGEDHNFVINGATPYYNTMRGIVRDVTTAGSAPNFDGYLEVYNMPAGFTLQGLRFTHTIGTGTTITMHHNVGLIKLVDVFVQHTTGSGIYIWNKGSIELTRVESYGNLSVGAQYIELCPRLYG